MLLLETASSSESSPAAGRSSGGTWWAAWLPPGEIPASVRAVRVLGVLLFLLGCAATAYCTSATYRKDRPQDVLFGVLAPISLLIALTGLVLMFVPGFFG